MRKEASSLPLEILSLCENSTTPVSHICTENTDWLDALPRPDSRVINTVEQLHSAPADAAKIEHLLIYKALECADRPSTLRLLAQLRDQRCKQIHIGLESPHETAKTAIQTNDLVALGFTCHHQYRLASYDFSLFHFSLYDYKRTPDWLNNRFWANPGRWDKSRW